MVNITETDLEGSSQRVSPLFTCFGIAMNVGWLSPHTKARTHCVKEWERQAT